MTAEQGIGPVLPFALDELEIAAGVPLGLVEPDKSDEKYASPLEAFDAVVAEAVRRPPCVVLYSGGRDSAAVLAVAARIARREGLPDPLAVTVRFVTDPDSEETEWQELVVRHVGIQDWERIDVTDELDYLGPKMQANLGTHGVLWPAHAHLHQVATERAVGGSVLSGLHGDAVFTPNVGRRRLREIVYGRSRPAPREVLSVGLAVAPSWVRRRVVAQRMRGRQRLTWLDDAAQAALRRRSLEGSVRIPLRWDANIRTLRRFRYVHVAERSMEVLAAASGAIFRGPFGDARFLDALAAVGGPQGFASRTEVMRTVFAADLPKSLIEREDKARFRWGYWGPYSAEFAKQWDASGLPDFVNVNELCAQWLAATGRDGEEPPDSGASATAMQAAWLGGNVASG